MIVLLGCLYVMAGFQLGQAKEDIVSIFKGSPISSEEISDPYLMPFNVYLSFIENYFIHSENESIFILGIYNAYYYHMTVGDTYYSLPLEVAQNSPP